MVNIKLSIGLSLISLTAFAQHSIQSSVFDIRNNTPLELATIRLLNANDSSLVSGKQSDNKGDFQFYKVKPGRYIMKVSSVGFQEQSRNIIMDNKNLILKPFMLYESVKNLKEVDVKGTGAQMIVKNDTLEYNATSFKTQDGAVVEDMLKKMPGVAISSDGKITVNGQEIKKIRVDGKKFFNDDIDMATKNIPADMIEKVQVYDQKSDMAQLTGFEDNDTERILNLTTKSSRKHGIFGNINAGVGTDIGNNINKVRYDDNAFVNIMDNEAQTAIIGGGNNANNSRSIRGRWGGAAQNSGVTATQNLGINNNTTLNNKFKIGGDVSFNHSTNESLANNSRQSYLINSVYTDTSHTITHNENYATNIRLEAEWKPDSVNTLVFQPNISFNKSFSDNNNNYFYLTDNDTTTWGKNINSGNGTGTNFGFNVIYSHKFAKKGRTLTSNIQTGWTQNNNESYNYSLKNSADTSNLVDQFTKNLNNSFNYSVKLSYTEPLWNAKNLLETAFTYKSNINSNEKDQFNKDNFGNYTLKDSTYSNEFSTNFFSQTFELNYRHTGQNYSLMIGGKAEPAQTKSNQPDETNVNQLYTTEVINFSPTLRFQYNFSKKKFARLDYRGTTNQPSIDQMIPVKNNSDLMNETVGNPDLLPSFTNSLRFLYSQFNDKTFSSFNTMLSVDATKDAMVSNSIYDLSGKQYNQTVNTNMQPLNLFGNIMFNTPLFHKNIHLNTSTTGNYNTRYGYSSKGMDITSINASNLALGDLSETHSWGFNEQLSLTYSGNYIEIGGKGALKYSNTVNNLNPELAQTWNWTTTGNLVIHFPYKFSLSSDINYSTLSGYANFNQDALIWNASVDKALFKGKGTVSLKWNDILHQQQNIRQMIGDNYIQYSKYNTITSYAMLSFVYKINKFEGNRAHNRDFNQFGPPPMSNDNPSNRELRPPMRNRDNDSAPY